MNEINIEAIRQDTPGCEKLLHFNNAGAALQPLPVRQAVLDHLELENSVGGYRAEALANERLERFYTALSTLLNCRPDELAYVENATRAWDMAFYSIGFEAGDRILTARSEYASNFLAYLQVQKRHGVEIDVIPDDASGQLDVGAMEDLIHERTRLISITHVPTQGGLVNPAQAVGRVARKHGIPFLLDACQSVGQMPVDVQKIGCDMLAGTGRKFLRGPRATGFLYVRASLLDELDPPFIDLHAATWSAVDRYEWRPDARRFENWESNVAGKVGLAVAVEYALNLGLEAIEHRVVRLAEQLRQQLSSLPGITVHDLGENRCGIVSLRSETETATDIQARLAARGINTSVSTAPWARLDMEQRGLEELLRASVHYYNTGDEIRRFCAALSSPD